MPPQEIDRQHEYDRAACARTGEWSTCYVEHVADRKTQSSGRKTSHSPPPPGPDQAVQSCSQVIGIVVRSGRDEAGGPPHPLLLLLFQHFHLLLRLPPGDRISRRQVLLPGKPSLLFIWSGHLTLFLNLFILSEMPSSLAEVNIALSDTNRRS